MSMDTSHTTDAPSAWVHRFAPLIRRSGRVLDYACGAGRHTRMLAQMGYRVEAVDCDDGALRGLSGIPRVTVCAADLESGAWPYHGRSFDAVIVTNYLFRPRLPDLPALLGPDGILIYETFAAGNERYGRPRNPDFLLAPGELLELARGCLEVVAYEHLHVDAPRPAAVQRICAIARV